MPLLALGVNYQTAPLDVRGNLAFDYQFGMNIARALVDEGIVAEAVVVSTCNRTELYCEGQESWDPLRLLVGQLGLSFESIQPYIYRYSEVAAVTHLMRVACGLDSMVLGEVEILGQLKQAYTGAANVGTVGKYLGRLFQTTFAVAKETRNQTGIGVNPISIAYTGAKLSQRFFSDLGTVSVLYVGAGDLIHLVAQHLSSMGVRKMMFANRTVSHANRLARQFEGTSCGLEKIQENLVNADMVITGTASRLPLVGKGMVESALRSRKHRPMLMVDLSVPRNIEVEIADLEDVYLYSLDDLQKIIADNKRGREKAMAEAESLLQVAAEEFICWIHAQDHFKMLSLFRKKFEGIRDQLLEDNLRRLRAGENPESVLSRLAYHLTNRYLHEPTRRLRKASLAREQDILTLTNDLFELDYEIIDTK